MAVYTDVSFEELEGLLKAYDIGRPLSFKGIAEGVENSNFYLQTERGMSMLKSGALMALPFIGAVILTVLFGKLSDGLLDEEGVLSGGRRRMVSLLMLFGSVILLTPLVDHVYIVLVLITIALGGVASAAALNIALIGDLLRTSADSGRATGLLILGGNIFGILAPISSTKPACL